MWNNNVGGIWEPHADEMEKGTATERRVLEWAPIPCEEARSRWFLTGDGVRSPRLEPRALDRHASNFVWLATD
jgi:hypothetical protein